ncbi:hypothetical protein [Roseovarius amoyensis]|uniref:hypothetical protein n=1 Tax=Roseovarius amoyensis TaxID=2211448 RepID=UPI000DBE8AC5|nr:hypothetical protein [Roseovarius amoyensis]
MTMLERDLQNLHERILQATPDARLSLQPELAEMIAQMDLAGEHVPAAIRDLCEELTCAAIEAQFDNLPI